MIQIVTENQYILQSEIEAVIDDYQILNEYASLDLLTQFQESQHYKFYQMDTVTFYVRRYTPNYTILPNSPPRFDRTRIIQLEQTIDENNYLHCSCGYYERHRRPCRHVYTILDRTPNAMDCDISNLKIYSAHFGHSQNFTDICNNHLQMGERKGVYITLPLILDDQSRLSDLSYFQVPLNNLTLLNPVTGEVFANDEGFTDYVDDILEEGYDSIMDSSTLTEKESFKNEMNSYKRLHSLFAQTCDQITNQNQFELVRKKLQEAHKEVIEQNTKTVKKIKNTDEKIGVASLPVLDKRKKDTRLKPYNEN